MAEYDRELDDRALCRVTNYEVVIRRGDADPIKIALDSHEADRAAAQYEELRGTIEEAQRVKAPVVDLSDLAACAAGVTVDPTEVTSIDLLDADEILRLGSTARPLTTATADAEALKDVLTVVVVAFALLGAVPAVAVLIGRAVRIPILRRLSPDSRAALLNLAGVDDGIYRPGRSRQRTPMTIPNPLRRHDWPSDDDTRSLYAPDCLMNHPGRPRDRLCARRAPRLVADMRGARLLEQPLVAAPCIAGLVDTDDCCCSCVQPVVFDLRC